MSFLLVTLLLSGLVVYVVAVPVFVIYIFAHPRLFEFDVCIGLLQCVHSSFSIFKYLVFGFMC